MTRQNLAEWYDHVRNCSACQYQVKKTRKNILAHLIELEIEITRKNMFTHVKECRKCFRQLFKVQWLISWFYFEKKLWKFLLNFKFWY